MGLSGLVLVPKLVTSLKVFKDFKEGGGTDLSVFLKRKSSRLRLIYIYIG